MTGQRLGYSTGHSCMHDSSHAGAQHHPHHNGHRHGHEASSLPRLVAALSLTLAFALVEVAAGWWSGSLALLADAGHMATDSLSLGLAGLAAWLSVRPASARHSYGLQRSEVLMGFINALLMLAVIVALAVASVQRLLHPQPVQGEVVSVVAVAGLLVNVVVALMLARGVQTFNTRGALLHVMGDLLGSVAALVAGLVISLTGWTPIDPILTLSIAALILASTVRLLMDAVNTLMEGVPRHLSLQAVGHAIVARPHVRSVHDLHLWTVSSHQVALSAHLVIDDLGCWEEVLADLGDTLKQLGIDHLTLQPVPFNRRIKWVKRDQPPAVPPPQ